MSILSQDTFNRSRVSSNAKYDYRESNHQNAQTNQPFTLKAVKEVINQSNEELNDGISADLDSLIKAQTSRVNVKETLPSSLAEPITKLASRLNLRPEAYFSVLLAVVGGIVKTDTKLVLSKALDFEVTPNLYLGVVAESSQMKSPIFKAIASKPLALIQDEAKKEYNRQKQDYQESLSKWGNSEKGDRGERPEEPHREIYYFTNATNEGIRNQMEKRPDRGLLAMVDELAGFLKSPNAYRNGKGSDEEEILSYYDGSGTVALRADGLRETSSRATLGVVGTIQPSVLQKLMVDNSDPNGKWARFLFVNQPLSPSQMPDGNTPSLDITPVLVDLYQRVIDLPAATYHLDAEASDYFGKVWSRLEDKRINDPSPAMRATWGKTRGQIGKLALNLHLIKNLMNRQIPLETIDLQTIKMATLLASFYVHQKQSLLAGLDGSQIPRHYAQIIKTSSEKQGWIKARDVLPKAPKGTKAEEVRRCFQELAAMGKGQIRGEGKSMEFSIAGVAGKFADKSPANKTLTSQDSQPFAGIAGVAGTFAENNLQGIAEHIPEQPSVVELATNTETSVRSLKTSDEVSIRPGDRVKVLEGSSKGGVGIVQRWREDIGGWEVNGTVAKDVYYPDQLIKL